MAASDRRITGQKTEIFDKSFALTQHSGEIRPDWNGVG
jgi:hypothetical protein